MREGDVEVAQVPLAMANNDGAIQHYNDVVIRIQLYSVYSIGIVCLGQLKRNIQGHPPRSG